VESILTNTPAIEGEAVSGDELAAVDTHGADLVITHPDPGVWGAGPFQLEIFAHLMAFIIIVSKVSTQEAHIFTGIYALRGGWVDNIINMKETEKTG
jgi:hypothetical protein